MIVHTGAPGKGNVSYEVWKQEVTTFASTGYFRGLDLIIAIRKSLDGLAADVLYHLEQEQPTGISISALVEKMDNIFGNVLPLEAILEQFWSARQMDGESISAWSCRLEHLVALVRSKDASIFLSGNDSMLQTKFWSGLSEERMKSALRYHMDSNSTYAAILS